MVRCPWTKPVFRPERTALCPLHVGAIAKSATLKTCGGRLPVSLRSAPKAECLAKNTKKVTEYAKGLINLSFLCSNSHESAGLILKSPLNVKRKLVRSIERSTAQPIPRAWCRRVPSQKIRSVAVPQTRARDAGMGVSSRNRTQAEGRAERFGLGLVLRQWAG
jgi:hypothetical protein